jgi:hypothetical protein
MANHELPLFICNSWLLTTDSDFQLANFSQSQSYFTTGGLPAFNSSWPKPLEVHDQIFFLQLNPCGHSPYVISSMARGWVCLLWIGFAFVKCTYRTYSMLSKIFPFALYTNSLSVQALQSRSCLAHLFHATTHLSHLNGHKLDCLQVEASCIFYVWLLVLCC